MWTWLQQMPLSERVRKTLQDHVFQAPEAGLFVCSAANPEQHVACPRDDVVQKLIYEANTLNPVGKVVLVHGMRRSGKSFSMPWAQLEAIKVLEAGRSRRQYCLFVPCQASSDLDNQEIYELLIAVVRTFAG